MDNGAFLFALGMPIWAGIVIGAVAAAVLLLVAVHLGIRGIIGMTIEAVKERRAKRDRNL